MPPIIVKNQHFIAEGTPGNLGGQGRDGAGRDPYEAAWQVWGIACVAKRPDGSDEIRKDDLFIKGFVKWDGCSNWTFLTDPCMHHQCGLEGLQNIGDILGQCWTKSKELMPNTWCGQ